MSVKGPIFLGEEGKAFIFTLKDKAGNPIDLTDYTITLILKKPSDGSEVERTLEVYGDEANGQARFVTTSLNAFDEVGKWKSKIRLTKTGTKLYYKAATKEDGIYVEDPEDED